MCVMMCVVVVCLIIFRENKNTVIDSFSFFPFLTLFFQFLNHLKKKEEYENDALES